MNNSKIESTEKAIEKVNSDKGWTEVQKKHAACFLEDYRFRGVQFHRSEFNPMCIPALSSIKLEGPPLSREELWWTDDDAMEFKEEQKYVENCEVFERLTGRPVVFIPPTDDMLDVFRTLKRPIFLARHSKLLQSVINVLLGLTLRKDSGGLTTKTPFLDIGKGCIGTAKSPSGGGGRYDGTRKSKYISFKCDDKGDVQLSHGLIGLAYGVQSLIPVFTGAFEVSHLCHFSTCANIDHLLIETSVSNREMRRTCSVGVHRCLCRPVACIKADKILSDYEHTSINTRKGKNDISVEVDLPPYSNANCFEGVPSLDKWMILLDIRQERKHVQPIRVDPARSHMKLGIIIESNY